MSRIKTSEDHDEIIKLAGEFGWITIDEAKMIIDYKRAYNVLAYMVKKGTLGTFPTRLRPEKGLYLTHGIRMALEQSGQVAYVDKFFPHMYRPTNFFHHVMSIRVYLALKKIYGAAWVEYFSAGRLKQEGGRRKICDGEYLYQAKDGARKRIGIEIELTLKCSDVRRKQMRNLAEYVKEKNLTAVIIFINREIVKMRLKETFVKYVSSPPAIYFIDINKFFAETNEVIAEALSGEKIKLFER